VCAYLSSHVNNSVVLVLVSLSLSTSLSRARTCAHSCRLHGSFGWHTLLSNIVNIHYCTPYMKNNWNRTDVIDHLSASSANMIDNCSHGNVHIPRYYRTASPHLHIQSRSWSVMSSRAMLTTQLLLLMMIIIRISNGISYSEIELVIFSLIFSAIEMTSNYNFNEHRPSIIDRQSSLIGKRQARTTKNDPHWRHVGLGKRNLYYQQPSNRQIWSIIGLGKRSPWIRDETE
jgi:hypothetical protein